MFALSHLYEWGVGGDAYVKERLETLLEKHISYVRSLLGHGGRESSLFSTSFYADEKIWAYLTNLCLHILFP